MTKVQVYKIYPEAKIPTRNYSTDAGLDLYALEDTFIALGKTVLVKTGIAINIPKGYMGSLRERSSVGKAGLKVAGGVIDSGYSGDVSVLLMNVSNTNEKEIGTFFGGYKVKKGDRIAQILLTTVETPEVEEVTTLWNSERSSRGFGSSGA